MKDDAKKLGENLKKIRTKKNITQTELAKTLGVDKSFVSNIENGKTNPTLSTITNLAQTLGMSTNELLK
jgi:transcriptional regulator with XRE-family HTH domain